MKSIHTVGVVGAGTMGSALAQKFAQEGFNVILADREKQFVDRGLNNIQTMLNEGVQRKVFKEEQARNIISRIIGSAVMSDLKKCDLIVEAIFEDFNAKSELFKSLSEIVAADTILATNTSSFSVDELAKSVSHPERFIGLHYFYHAAKNRLVEIIPGSKTSQDTLESAKIFSMMSGKDAITCKDSFGFVVNRFFVPWLNEAARLLEENVATIAIIDDVCKKTFGIGMGPFTLMNATGIVVAYHSQKTLEVFGRFYHVSQRLKQQADLKQLWEVGGEVTNDDVVAKIISDRMMGVVFLVCEQLLDEKVCTVDDINRGARIGLRWKKGPVELMQQAGADEVQHLVKQIAERYKIELPHSTFEKLPALQFVNLELKGNCALITINHPEDLNALNESILNQIDEKFQQAENNSAVRKIFITGSGKAFVAGADISFFIRNMKKNKMDDIEKFTAYGQKVFERIDKSQKKVIAILNGLTLGGGLELALCADVILALPKAQMAFPETGIGIYPGLGGTLRSAHKVGKGLSKFLIHTGKMLNAKEANEIGLVDQIISFDEMFDFIAGKKEISVIEKIPLNEKWKSIENFFEKYSLEEILGNNFKGNGITQEEAEKISKTIHRKAPLALRLADKLIDDAGAKDSELRHIKEIFSTSDALLGLCSVGKQVEYHGN